jgi:hypothetical protein
LSILAVEEDFDMPRFEKGNQFSTGRQLGARNKSTLWLDAVNSEDTERVIHVVQEKAEKGDMYAAALLLARTWPRRRGRPIQLDLPPVTDTGGLVAAQAVLVAVMAKGEISPDEAASVAGVLETQRRAIETNDHELRIQELEQQAKDRKGAAPDPLLGTS